MISLKKCLAPCRKNRLAPLSKKGQAILEYLLLMTIVFGIWTGVSKVLLEKGVFQKIFGEPWARLSNTIEYGVPSNKPVATFHPASLDRHSTRLEK